MQPVLNVEDVRAVEQSLAQNGVSVSELMHRAGAAAAQEIARLEGVTSAVILVGLGNNGGDGWVAAECLHKAGMEVKVVAPCEIDMLHSDLARIVAKSAIEAGVPFVVGPSRDELIELIAGADAVLDAMLGTGFHGEPVAPFSIWIDVLNESGARVVAVDVPSGLSAQTGHAPGSVVIADVTITMLALKPGLLADEGRDVCGSIVVAPLAEQTSRLVYDADPVAWRCETPDYLDVLVPPTCVIDKYMRGSVLVVGGSGRFPGAAIMAAKAAARAGAGYVTLAVPQSIVPIVSAHLLEIPVVGLASAPDGTFGEAARAQVADLAKHASAVLVGPGMCVTGGTVGIVSTLLSTKAPLVIDADGLNCLATLTSNSVDEFPELMRREAPLVLTPHRRELGRLIGLDAAPDSLTSALEAARRIVWANGGSELVVVAKGTATACVGVDMALLPKPGPSCLATAGSGDVLAGITTGLLARSADTQNLALLSALACEVHGCAASIAQERYGTRGVMASDLIEVVGLALDAIEDHAAYYGAAEYDAPSNQGSAAEEDSEAEVFSQPASMDESAEENE